VIIVRCGGTVTIAGNNFRPGGNYTYRVDDPLPGLVVVAHNNTPAP
jgi:hypothetical protein